MQPEKNNTVQVITRTLAAGGIGLALTLLLLLFASVLLLQGILSPGWVGVCPYVALGLGALGCGVASSQCPKRLYGALGGGLLMALCLGLLGLLYTKTDLSPLGVIVSLVLSLLTAALGSIVTSLFR